MALFGTSFHFQNFTSSNYKLQKCFTLLHEREIDAYSRAGMRTPAGAGAGVGAGVGALAAGAGVAGLGAGVGVLAAGAGVAGLAAGAAGAAGAASFLGSALGASAPGLLSLAAMAKKGMLNET